MNYVSKRDKYSILVKAKTLRILEVVCCSLVENICFHKTLGYVTSLDPLGNTLFAADYILNLGRTFFLEVHVETVVENVRALLSCRVEALHIRVDVNVA